MKNRDCVISFRKLDTDYMYSDPEKSSTGSWEPDYVDLIHAVTEMKSLRFGDIVSVMTDHGPRVAWFVEYTGWSLAPEYRYTVMGRMRINNVHELQETEDGFWNPLRDSIRFSLSDFFELDEKLTRRPIINMVDFCTMINLMLKRGIASAMVKGTYNWDGTFYESRLITLSWEPILHPLDGEDSFSKYTGYVPADKKATTKFAVYFGGDKTLYVSIRKVFDTIWYQELYYKDVLKLSEFELSDKLRGEIHASLSENVRAYMRDEIDSDSLNLSHHFIQDEVRTLDPILDRELYGVIRERTADHSAPIQFIIQGDMLSPGVYKFRKLISYEWPEE